MSTPYPSFQSFIDHIVELNIILDPEWEFKLYKLQRKITLDNLGYPKITEFGKRGRTIGLHRIVNNTPEGMVTDHINRDVSDCRAVNLRTVTSQQNSINTSLFITNKSGIRGVSQDPISLLWVASLIYKGKKYRKKFKSLEDAIAYRKSLEIKLHGKYAPK